MVHLLIGSNFFSLLKLFIWDINTHRHIYTRSSSKSEPLFILQKYLIVDIGVWNLVWIILVYPPNQRCWNPSPEVDNIDNSHYSVFKKISTTSFTPKKMLKMFWDEQKRKSIFSNLSCPISTQAFTHIVTVADWVAPFPFSRHSPSPPIKSFHTPASPPPFAWTRVRDNPHLSSVTGLFAKGQFAQIGPRRIG